MINKNKIKKIVKVGGKKIIFFPILMLDYIVPKNKKQILFASSGRRNFSGNSKKLYEDFKYNSNYTIKYTQKEKKEEINYINLKSISGIIYFLRTKYLIGTHGIGDFLYPFSRNKIFIQTWHGSPLKKMGLADNMMNKFKKMEVRRKEKKITYFFSNSEVVSSSLVRCFGLKEKKLLNIGYPRNDHLVNYKKTGDLGKQFGSKKVILYAPTFRDWTNIKLFPFENFDFEKLEKKLEELDAVLLLRSHVNEKDEQVIRGKRVIEFNFDKCEDINEVLGEVDLLITDYSSIYFDYLLLDKPTIFLPYDLEEYRKKRGFLYDSYKSIMIGDIVSEGKEFIEKIEKNLKNDEYEKRRKVVKELFNYNQTSNTYKKLIMILEKGI